MPKRMLKNERREQLLSVAVSIIRERGTDALTLARVAEEAGVTKPIAYNHFESKENLLRQIYQNIDIRLIESIRLAQETKSNSVQDTIAILCESYINCMMKNGEIYELTVAALKGYPHNSTLSKDIQQFFTNAYSDLFQLPLSEQNDLNRIKLVAVYGLIESVGSAVLSEQISKDSALSFLNREIYRLISSQ
ncbi:TetR/AcrR family transcriptional regulator [Vibrio sp. SCSIO 43137]|uniref:TetR/AcrR family transcriptional regulator n=1 Tax=Vibrio sp. SCSIO 43137 TaxID=3021011 RepID=UPI0023077F62|nr:TetR/AcrR family transcriptional regulator [Vibrio sp. SCSIO 43137]WCE30073.1 TetR/AcrR family transcriptional regulator [Vibrio sp. SCSIO 43137]